MPCTSTNKAIYLYNQNAQARRISAVMASNSESREEITGEFLPHSKNDKESQETADIFVGR